MTERTSLSLLLKRYRMAAGLSQEALAQRAALSARAISDLERGLHRAPHPTTLDLLASALSLSPQQRALFLAAARPELAGEPQEINKKSEQGKMSTVALPREPPAPLTALIGREREFSQALALFQRDGRRLVTLTGPSGVGKTRLALEIARALLSAFRDGVVFVDLASIRDAALVPEAIAQALGLREQGSAPLDQQIRVHLHDKQLLLLLDNFEHVIEAARFMADLLARLPHLAALVTSRAPLRLRGEQLLQLAPLALEDAIILFRERAHAVRPETSFTVSDMAAICERMDRLPLAIELAAGQVSALSLAEVLERLDHHAALALEGARDLPARQRTMEAAIGWGYDLLTASQQRCFRALGVFVGGMTLAAARAVCWDDDTGAEAETLVTLAALVDASLIQVETAPGSATRFYLLELVRAFALQRLHDEGEEEARKLRHAHYFAALAATTASAGAGWDTAVSRFAPDISNVRAALEWADERRDAEIGLRLAGFARLWSIRGAGSEAERWLGRMLMLDAEARAGGEPCAPLSLRVERLYGYARVLLNLGKLAQAEDIAQESVALAKQIEDRERLIDAYATLGMVAQARGDIEQATSAFTESVAYAGAEARSGSHYRALFYLAELARYQGDNDRAHRLLEDALAGARAAENVWDGAVITTMLGHVERQQRNNAQARQHYLEGLARFHSFANPAFFAWCLEGLSALLCAEGSYARAAKLCAAAAAFRTQARAPLPVSEREAFERTLARARMALGDAAFDSEWIAGSALTETDALAEARAESEA